MVQIKRKYNFVPGTTIASGQMNEEFNNLIDAHNNNDLIVQNLNQYGFYKKNVQAGKTDLILVNRGQTLQHKVAYTPAFSQIPFVVITPHNGDAGMSDMVVFISQSTATSFTISLQNKSTTKDTSLSFNYIAISMG